MVKTPQGEWKITTPLGKGLDGDFQRKKDIIIRNTRERYCKSRQEVEREIAERIKPDEIRRQPNGNIRSRDGKVTSCRRRLT